MAVAALGLLAVGCASRPPPALAPVSEVPENASVVPMLVGATRRPAEDPALLFSGERTLRLNHASLSVTIPPGHRAGDIAWSTVSPPDPRTSFAAASAAYLDQAAFEAALRARIGQTGRRHVLVFVHGFNTRFDEAAFRFAQIVNDSGAQVTPVLFSWASRGAISAYPYDRTSAEMGRDGLAALLARLAAEPAVSEVSILAHSMGNIVVMEALRTLALRNGSPPAKIRQFMMAAPDVDVDLAMQSAIAMGPRRPHMTLFISRDDRALNLSRWIWSSRDRLGSIDPTQEPYRTNLRRFGVDVIDLTDIPADDSLAHGKFAQSPQVVRLLGARLAAGQGLSTDRIGLGDVAAGATRGALDLIGTVLTAPVTLGQDAGRDGGIARGLESPASQPAPAAPAARQPSQPRMR